MILTRKLRDSIDPNLILMDTTPLLNTEIDDIRRDFNKLLKRLRDTTPDDPDVDTEELEGPSTILNPSSFADPGFTMEMNLLHAGVLPD